MSKDAMKDVIDEAARSRRIDFYRRLQDIAVTHRDASARLESPVARDIAYRMAVVIEAACSALLKHRPIETKSLFATIPVFSCACEILGISRNQSNAILEQDQT